MRNTDSHAEPSRGGGGNNSNRGTVLLRNGRVLDPAGGLDETADVLVRDGTIESIGKGIAAEPGARVMDLTGKLAVPGLIDMHVHLREPGREDEETIQSGGRAAAAGGFTAVACMANTRPVVDNAGMVRFVVEAAKKRSPVRVFCVGAGTVGLKGEAMTEIMDMRDAGAVAISDDGKFIQNSEVARRVMEYCRMAGLPFISHCEDQYLSAGGDMHEGYWSTVLGLKGIPAAAETVAVAREVSLAELTGARVHIAHVSAGESVDVVRRAKERGLTVTAETAPHYLVLTDRAVCGYDTNAKVNPPLRSEEDRERVVAGLKDGTIDVIASDHAPHCEEEKDVEFAAAAFGLIGLETSVGVIMTFLVRKGIVPLKDAIAAMTVKPAAVLGIDGGTLAAGRRADITIIDPELEWEVDPSRFASGARNTPFRGMKLTGKAVATMVAGKLVYEEPH
ncbi:MAG: dihydroorotase [Candidatus Eisenbacteria bacterium]|nr:dihydroorotase [Candidatus Eisenbacteria bacterium]